MALQPVTIPTLAQRRVGGAWRGPDGVGVRAHGMVSSALKSVAQVARGSAHALRPCDAGSQRADGQHLVRRALRPGLGICRPSAHRANITPCCETTRPSAEVLNKAARPVVGTGNTGRAQSRQSVKNQHGPGIQDVRQVVHPWLVPFIGSHSAGIPRHFHGGCNRRRGKRLTAAVATTPVDRHEIPKMVVTPGPIARRCPCLRSTLSLVPVVRHRIGLPRPASGRGSSSSPSPC